MPWAAGRHTVQGKGRSCQIKQCCNFDTAAIQPSRDNTMHRAAWQGQLCLCSKTVADRWMYPAESVPKPPRNDKETHKPGCWLEGRRASEGQGAFRSAGDERRAVASVTTTVARRERAGLDGREMIFW
eukprot:6189714-Pleurochrysis_carterae.AAC.4